MFLDFSDEIKEKNNVFDDVEIVVDPELEDESTVDINDYLNKHILQCRICGNMFPSNEILDNDAECPICDSKSPDGFIYKGKLINKKKDDSDNEDESDELSDEEIDAIQNLEDDVPYDDEDYIDIESEE